MKTIKQLLLAIFLVAIATQVLSNEKIRVRADTVRIKFENCMLEIATFDLKKNTLEKAEIKNKVNELLSELEKIEITAPVDGEKICIRYTNFIGGVTNDFKKLNLSSLKNDNKTLVIADGEFLETDFGNIVLEVEDENYLLRLYLENLEDAKRVNSQEFGARIIAADGEIPENRKKTNAWLTVNENGSVGSHFIGEVAPLTLDMLEINAGVGAGWIQNQFVSSFNFRLGMAFAKKGIMKNKYFADYELLYDFSNSEGDNKFDINGFLSLGYEKNFSLDPNKANWYGISAGYLVGRGNEFFEKNTYKVAVHKQISNSITIKPEIYFNDFFKNGSPGLRVQITF